MRSLTIFLAACSAILCSVAIASPHSLVERSGKPPTVSLVYQFATKGSWLENLAVRSNGDLLVTRLDVPELWLISPYGGAASKLYSFPNATGLLSVTEIGHDIFAVISSVFDLDTVTAGPGSFVVWKVDLRGPHAVVSVIKAIPEALFLNGMARFNQDADVVLITDSKKAAIWRLNTKTGAYSIALSDKTMTPTPGGPQVGVNGVQIRNQYVYYTSSTQQLLCRVPVDRTASAVGPFEVVAKTGQFVDDFTVIEDGTAYVTTNPTNSVIKVRPQGQVSTVVGGLNSSVVAGATACAFDPPGSDTLFIVTGGARAAPVNGTFTEPAKVVSIRLDSKYGR